MTIEEFPEFSASIGKAIRESILSGTYQPLPVRRVEIPKQTGGTRPLGIPIVLDRLIQQAIAQVLVPIFDPGFSESSYRIQAGEVGTRCRPSGSGVHPRRLSHGRGHGSVQVFRHREPRRAYAPSGAKSPGQTGASPDRKVPPCRSGGERSPPEDPERVFLKEVRCHRFWQTSFWMTSTRSLRNVAIGSPGTQTTSSFW